MRLIIAALVFLMASVTIAGSLLTVVLSPPQLGLDGPWAIAGIAVVGFAVAAPFSYWVAGLILKATQPQAASKGPLA